MKLRTIRKSSSSYFDVLQKTQILALKLDSALIDVILTFLVVGFDTSNVMWIRCHQCFHQLTSLSLDLTTRRAALLGGLGNETCNHITL